MTLQGGLRLVVRDDGLLGGTADPLKRPAKKTRQLGAAQMTGPEGEVGYRRAGSFFHSH